MADFTSVLKKMLTARASVEYQYLEVELKLFLSLESVTHTSAVWEAKTTNTTQFIGHL